MNEPTGPAGSDASQAARAERSAKLPKQRTKREEYRRTDSRTQDTAREIEAEGRAGEMAAAAMRQGLVTSTDTIVRLNEQLVSQAAFIGQLQARLALAEDELGKHRRKDKKKDKGIKIAELDADVRKTQAKETASVYKALIPHAAPTLLPELVPLLRIATKAAGKILPMLAASTADQLSSNAPRAAGMRLVARLYAEPKGEDDELGQQARDTLASLRHLAGDDWPLVEEWLVSQMAEPASAAQAAAPH